MSLPVLQAIEHFGLRGEIVAGQFRTRCPFHDEATASFDIRLKDGVWSCFGCGRSGGLVDFVALLDGGDGMRAVQLINRLRRKPTPDTSALFSVEGLRGYIEHTMTELDLDAQWGAFHKVNWTRLSMSHPAAAYLIGERGFARSTLDAFDVRLTEWSEYPIVIPWRRGDELIGYVYRYIVPKPGLKKYKFNKGFSAETSMAYYKVGGGPLLICEGITDLMKAAQFGARHAACIPSWRLNEAHAMWLQAQGIQEFVCGLDNTPTGDDGFKRMKRMLPIVYRFKFPGKFRKDIGDLNVNEFNWGMP